MTNNPKKHMTIEERAEQMWQVHPKDLDELGLSRQEFYEAHLNAAVDGVTQISAEKLILFCDKQLVALHAVRKEIDAMKKAAQSLINKKSTND